jgi:hypothetical protein
LAVFCRRKAIDVEDSKFGSMKLESNRRELESFECVGRRGVNSARIADKKCSATTNHAR